MRTVGLAVLSTLSAFLILSVWITVSVLNDSPKVKDPRPQREIHGLQTETHTYYIDPPLTIYQGQEVFLDIEDQVAKVDGELHYLNITEASENLS